MSARVASFQADPSPPPSRAAIAELSRVRLRAATTADGRELPQGGVGTVVHAYAGGRGFEVEFNSPFHAVVTLSSEQIEPHGG